MASAEAGVCEEGGVAKVETVEFPVPEGVAPGETLEVQVGPSKESVVLRLPARVRLGDRLRLSRPAGAGAEGWTCNLISPAPTKAGTIASDVTYLRVPEDADGKMMVEVHGQVLKLAIPPQVTAGDYLELAERDGKWQCAKVAAGTPAAERAAAEVARRERMARASRLRSTRLPTSGPPSPQVLYERLVLAARSAGAFVSPKVVRGAAPPLGIVGMVAQEEIRKGDVLVRMPFSLILSPTAAREVVPHMHEAMLKVAGIPERRVLDMFQAAYLASLFKKSERMFQQDTDAPGESPDGIAPEPPASTSGDIPEGRGSAALLELWGRYADSLVYEPFEEHPYCLCLDDLPAFITATEPSREHQHISRMAGDVVAMADIISSGIGPEVLGEGFDVGAFMQARLCLLTRVFQVHEESSLVPIADLFNHNSDPSALWSLDADANEFVITAVRDTALGEEVLVSYGPRSNALLFRTYGFTLAPEQEPAWSYLTQTNLSAVCARYLPADLRCREMLLDTLGLQECLIGALNACLTSGADAVAFLRELVSELIAPYEVSANFAPAREALQRVRASDPRSAAWWTEADMPPEGLALHAMRVSMCEYLCLTAHLEALDLADGTAAEELCLAGASDLRASVLEAAATLRSGRCVQQQQQQQQLRPP